MKKEYLTIIKGNMQDKNTIIGKNMQEKYPTTTEIIYDVLPLSFVPDEWYATKGTYIHQAINMSIRNILDIDSLDRELLPYVVAFNKFIEEYKIKILESEKRYFCDKLKFSGQVDIICRINNKEYVIDIKSARAPIPQWRLQTSAYAYLVGLSYRAVMYWSNNGWKLEEHKDKSDFYIFQSCLNIYNFKRKENMR